jgi:hypothetical protein
MKISIPYDLYIELATKNINLMDYTANPYLLYSTYSGTVDLDLDRVPFFYAKDIINNSVEFFKQEIEKIEIELNNNELRDYEISKLNNNKKQYENYLKSIKLYVAYRDGSIKLVPKTLQQMYYSLRNFLDEELPKSENHWMYKYVSEHNIYQPYLITDIDFHQKRDKNDKDFIIINYVAISNNKTDTTNLYIYYDDMKKHKRNPKELLMGLGFYFEEEEWLTSYTKVIADFHKKATMQNIEFVNEQGHRFINDNFHSISYSKAIYEDSKVSKFGEKNEFKKVPIIPSIYVYNLNTYCFEYIDTRMVEPYIYDVDIEKKLILPKDHKNLIDILLSEEYQSHDADFIKGKGNGTLILAKGKAGLGKTLTSEVYAERKKIARLKIHASQLGTDESKIENRLKNFMLLAERWKCILLIDEADVYIRKRDNDVQHNAIVATMLQQIEYFNGILFMTTNRTDDIDEAILSRCSAILSYDMPSKEMAKELWKIFLEQNDLVEKISEETLETILVNFPTIAGRDIRNIISLASKYALGNNLKSINFEVFKLCATFRGIYSIGEKH